MFHIENSHLAGRFTNSLERLIMNLFGPPDRSPIDMPIIHKNDDAEASSVQQLMDIEIERDDEGHVWAERKDHTVADQE